MNRSPESAAQHRQWERWLADDLDSVRSSDRYRSRQIVRPLDAIHVEIAGRRLVNFASNNYLGLTHHPAVIGAVAGSAQRDGAGSGAAALISGYAPVHASAEAAIARWKGAAAAVLLPSGYQANHAAVQTIAAVAQARAGQSHVAAGFPPPPVFPAFGSEAQARRGEGRGGGANKNEFSIRKDPLPASPGLPGEGKESGGAEHAIALQGRRGVRFLIDKLCHASLIDAVRATGAPFRVFPHNHLAKLERLLAGGDEGVLQAVITESIYSMDGDAADLLGLSALRERFGFVWLLDEAHATGVYGANGSGLAAELGLSDAVDVSVVTLSKALGGVGGAVCGSAAFCEAMINRARAFIYSTNIPASAAAAAEAAIGVVEREPQRRRRVRQLAAQVRQSLDMAGDSPIVPIIMGTEAAAMEAAEGLRQRGMLVVAVRPPTVAPGSSRLRITVSSEHGDEEVAKLIDAVKSLRRLGTQATGPE